MKSVIAFGAALLFGMGLVLSGMTDPKAVIGFLDIFGDWKPQLILVMVGAIIVNVIAYRIVYKMEKPFISDIFHIPTLKHIDRKLLVGAALFGTGWGIAGFCPGPAIASILTLDKSVLLFVVSMIVGTFSYKKIAT